MEFFIILITFFIFFTSIFSLISDNTVHSIFWLIFTFINSIILMILNNMHMIAIILLIIYVGAIAILFLFSVMMINLVNVSIVGDLYYYLLLPIFFFFFIVYIKLYLIVVSYEELTEINVKTIYPIITLINDIYNNLSWYIIISSLILLVPMIGVLILI